MSKSISTPNFDKIAQSTAVLILLLIRDKKNTTAKSTARPSCLVGVLYDISPEKICWRLINHLYVIGQESYRIRRNKAK